MISRPIIGLGHFACWVTVIVAAQLLCPASLRAAETSSTRWESEIRAFERADQTNPPPKGAILFVGSSSIRLWKTLAEDFNGFAVINRGFGGSQMADSVQYADRIVLPYRPKQILVYAGDNDLAAGKAPKQVLADFRSFVETVHHAWPETRIGYIAIKPSPSRWKLADQARTANRLVAEFTRSDQRLDFIDVFTPMLDEEGKPKADLFVADNLHLNSKGYQLWRSIVLPYLQRPEKR